jgi:hypothetical protein
MSSRTTKFLNRIDAHLPTLATDQARRAFLAKQFEAWHARYSKFIASAGASEPVIDPSDPPQATDFLLTVVGLKARRDALVS